ncbi:MAG: hypothetical protein HZA90_22550 [Verrucomicrobia bacterium]|nr:hypothetical protein [Verrucomicrobiota bacterium]
MKTIAAVVAGLVVACRCEAGIILTGTAYSQTFDSLGTGLPGGWGVYTDAGSSSLGTVGTFTSAKSYWSASSAGFYNVASANGLTASATTAAQNNSVDRALGIRQAGTPSGYDPGAAVVLEIQSTTGFKDFTLSFKALMLDVNPRSTTWTFDYRVGGSGSFTSLGTYSDPAEWGPTPVTFTPTDLASWNDQASSVFFRVLALSGSSESGTRDMIGIDDVSLSFVPVPEPVLSGWLAAGGLLAIAGFRSWRRGRSHRASPRA